MSGKGALPRSFMVEETDGCVASAEINQIREKIEPSEIKGLHLIIILL